MPPLTPTDAESSLRALIRKHVLRERAAFALGALVVTLGVVATIASPQAMKRFIDGLVATRDESSMIWLVVLLALMFAEAATRVIHGILFHGAASRIALGAERDAFARFLVQPVSFFDDERSVELAGYLRSCAETLRDFIARELPDLQRAWMRLITGSVALVVTAPRLALYLALIVPPLLALSSFLARRLKKASEAASLAGSHTHAAAQESIGAIRVVRGLGVEHQETARFRLIQASSHAASLLLGRLASWSDGASLLLSEFVTLMALAIGGRMVVSAELTVGELVSFLVYADLSARSSRDLVRFRAQLGSLRGVFAPLQDRLARTVVSAAPAQVSAPSRSPGSIAVRAVRFAYPVRPDRSVLDGVNLVVNPGDRVAIVGESGSGKSTLLSLLAGFYAPLDGEILLDGKTPHVGAQAWQSESLAYLNQGARAFSRSLRDNIVMGREVDEAALARVIRLAGLEPLLAALPGGLDGVPGEGGAQVSGGEAQRLAIARALYRRPSILLLDEATAALDPESEGELFDALGESPDRPTVVVVSHRLSTIRRASRIAVLSDGRILDTGAHEDLVRTCETYRRIISEKA